MLDKTNSPRKAFVNVDFFINSTYSKIFPARSFVRCSRPSKSSRRRTISFCSSNGGKKTSAFNTIFSDTRGRLIPLEFATAYSMKFGRLKKFYFSFLSRLKNKNICRTYAVKFRNSMLVRIWAQFAIKQISHVKYIFTIDIVVAEALSNSSFINLSVKK